MAAGPRAEEIVLQNPGAVALPRDRFCKRAAAKLGFKMKINKMQ